MLTLCAAGRGGGSDFPFWGQILFVAVAVVLGVAIVTRLVRQRKK